jgi:hypothetical protein
MDADALRAEIGHQLAVAADGRCPNCDRTDPVG